MKKITVGINGFGRIGRAFLKAAWERPELSIVAVNDLGNVSNLAYLLKYDSAYGKCRFEISARTDKSLLVVDGKEITVLSEREPEKLSWGKLGVDVVVESTGVFESYEKARGHLIAGAKKVVITAPVKDDSLPDIETGTVLMGVNSEKLKTCTISSNGSCTTNAGSPILQILNESIGIEKAVLNTIHAYTATQSLVDSPSSGDIRRGRAGADNIVPSSTGAAVAITKAITELSGKFDGVAVRVPVVIGSLVDVTFIAKRDTTPEEVNDIMRKASETSRWKEIFAVTEEELVSADIVGDSHGAVADLAMTRVVGGNLVKILAWYDNEIGYAHTLVLHVIETGRHLISS